MGSQSLASVLSATSLPDEEVQHVEEGMRSRAESQSETMSRAHSNSIHSQHPTSLQVQTGLPLNKQADAGISSPVVINPSVLPAKNPLSAVNTAVAQHTLPGTPSNAVSYHFFPALAALCMHCTLISTVSCDKLNVVNVVGCLVKYRWPVLLPLRCRMSHFKPDTLVSPSPNF